MDSNPETLSVCYVIRDTTYSELLFIVGDMLMQSLWRRCLNERKEAKGKKLDLKKENSLHNYNGTTCQQTGGQK